MLYENDEEIILLIRKFEDCTVTSEEWTHAAHLTAALWYALNHSFDEALNKMRSGIFKLNEAHGTPNTPTRGYHETLTVFWMRTVYGFLDKGVDKSDLCGLANDLINNCADSSWPLKFYNRALLFSPAARAKYVEPDLLIFESKIKL